LKLRSGLLVFFAVYIIALSFIPLIHNVLLAQERWVGYGNGAYAFQTESYFVLFNDPYDGSSKPHIQLNPPFAPAARISLLEFSDWTSWVNEYNLFNEFNVTMRASQRVLNATYSRPDVMIYKLVEVSSDAVKVTLRSDTVFKAHLELWRWVMTSVNGISIKDAPKPLAIAPTKVIEFAFEEERLQSVGHGRITLSAFTGEIKIWPHEKGFNKISIDIVNTNMTLTVAGSMEPIGTPSPTWSYGDLPYVFPVVAISLVALYLVVERHGRTHKNRATGISG